jgi:hypothetical protein
MYIDKSKFDFDNPFFNQFLNQFNNAECEIEQTEFLRELGCEIPTGISQQDWEIFISYGVEISASEGTTPSLRKWFLSSAEIFLREEDLKYLREYEFMD